MVTDNPTAYILVAKGDQRKLVKHHAPDRDGPATLSWFEQAIDIVRDDIKWEKSQ
jgi:hypothetical protein